MPECALPKPIDASLEPIGRDHPVGKGRRCPVSSLRVGRFLLLEGDAESPGA